jgi:phosphotriesterase-related protein
VKPEKWNGSRNGEVIQTVVGNIPADALGVTLSHEHLLINTVNPTFQEPVELSERHLAYQPVTLENRGWVELNWARNRDNLILDDEETAIAELTRFYRSGGDSLIDVTSIGIGRDPRALARIARATGVNIVMGSGYYVQPTHPPRVQEMSETAIRDEIIRDFAVGVGDTGIRAGVIGEIGCSWPLADDERKVLRAAAAAQSELACGLTIHPGRDPQAPGEIIEILGGGGADLRRVVIGHIERTIQDMPGLEKLAKTGCFIEWDIFGIESTAHFPYRTAGLDIPSDAQRLDQIAALCHSGYGSQILISHDICFKHRLTKYGGTGYEHILRNVAPWMIQRGFDADEVRGILVSNPRRAFATEVNQAGDSHEVKASAFEGTGYGTAT